MVLNLILYNEDNLILLLSFILYWIIFILLMIKSKNKIFTFIMNISLHLVYSIYFLYGLMYKSSGGFGLVWWFYLLVLLWIHSIFNLVALIYLFFKKKK